METNSKPRLLIFYDYFSPAFKAGGPIRSLRNMTALLQQSYEIYVFTAAVDLDGTPLPVEKDHWVIFENHLKVFYASSSKLNILYIHKVLKEIQPDTVYVNGLFTPYSVLLPLLAIKFYSSPDGLKPHLVLAPRGMLKESALALKAGKKKVYLTLFKLLRLQQNLCWHATDRQEGENIRQFAGAQASVKLISNVPLLPQKHDPKTKETGSLRLISVSLIAYTKNLLFLLRCLKQTPEKYNIRYDIYGPVKDEDCWQKMEHEINTLPAHIQVNYKGPLQPEKVVHTLPQYDCFVLPTLGENFGHSIFEALGAGLPVMISDQTPWRELEGVKAGWDLPLQQYHWISKIFELAAMQEQEYSQWRKGAYAYAMAYLEKQDLKEQYLQLFGIK